MAVYGNRIRELRRNSGLTQEALGKKLGVIKQTVSSWENNISEPNSEILSKLASLFDVSVDYILGKKNNIVDNNGHSFFFFDDLLKDVFTSRLKKAMDNKGLTEDAFLELIPSNKNNIKPCLSGDCEPSLEDLIDISNILGVSIDYLLGQITEQEDKYLHSFRSLNEDNKDIVIGDVKRYLKEQRYESVAAEDSTLRKASGK